VLSPGLSGIILMQQYRVKSSDGDRQPLEQVMLVFWVVISLFF